MSRSRSQFSIDSIFLELPFSLNTEQPGAELTQEIKTAAHAIKVDAGCWSVPCDTDFQPVQNTSRGLTTAHYVFICSQIPQLLDSSRRSVCMFPKTWYAFFLFNSRHG